MDEFTNIAIWVMIAFISINATVIWFSTSTTFTEHGLSGQGLTATTMGSASELNSLQTTTFFGIDCSGSSANPFLYAPCFIVKVIDTFNFVTNYIWNLLTAWVGLLDFVLSPFGSVGELFKMLFIPFFALVEITAIFVILLRVAAIIRGSG